MHAFFVFILVAISACSSSSRKPASDMSQFEIPKDALSLEQAFSQGQQPTLQYLKERLSVESYASMKTPDPGSDLPESLRASRAPATDEFRKELRTHLSEFRKMSWSRKSKKAQDLIASFQCEKVLESQAMGLSLELNFPNADASSLAEALHEKVIACEHPARKESVFRLAAFSIQKNQCGKAIETLKQFSATQDEDLLDRVSFMRGLCEPNTASESRNPWSGYGIQLIGSEVFAPPAEKPLWYLTASSGSVDWDRLLMSYIELVEKDQMTKLRHVAGLIDYEKFRLLPPSFQTSMMMLMNYAGADLAVFQTLHRYLSDHPRLMTKEIANLLFPIRFWKEILAQSKAADPILVKALIRQESAFNPRARSPAKAYGLMQLIYPTARRFGVKNRQQLFRPEVNIRAGSQFLAKLIREFGSVELALAAYNAGPQMVRDWRKRYPTENVELFVEMIPYSETREYVRLVSRNYKIYRQLLLQKPTSGPELAQK